MSKLPMIKDERIELLDANEVQSQFDQLTGVNDQLGIARERMRMEGFTPIVPGEGVQEQGGVRGRFGQRVTVVASEPIPPPDGATGDAVSEAVFTLSVQAYERGRDHAAVIGITAAAGAESHSQAIILEAAGGNPDMMIERAVENGQLTLADGWWDRFRGCLGRCGGPCLAALATCISSGALPAILACLAIRCGGCAAKCAACATCDCRWWCKWAAGCCEG